MLSFSRSLLGRQLGAISKLFINRYCESITPAMQLMAGYDVFDGQDAQCFELAASIAGGAYLLIPFVCGLALLGTYVVKAYIQYLRELQDEEEDISAERPHQSIGLPHLPQDKEEGPHQNDHGIQCPCPK